MGGSADVRKRSQASVFDGEYRGMVGGRWSLWENDLGNVAGRFEATGNCARMIWGILRGMLQIMGVGGKAV